MVAMNSGPIDPNDTSPSFNTIYAGRVSVGYQRAFGQADANIIAQLDAMADETLHPSISRLRIAIVAGELYSRGDAFERARGVETDSLRLNEQAYADELQADRNLLLRIYGSEQYVPGPRERQQLIDRHQWFGELAAGYNLAESDPLHREPRRDAAVLAWIIAAGGIALLFAMVVGLGLLITLIVLLAARKVALRMPAAPQSHPSAYVEMLAVFLLAFLVLQVAAGVFHFLLEVDLTAVVLLVLVLPVFWPLLFGVGFKQFRQDMGLVAPRGVTREIVAGLTGYIAGLPILAIGFGLSWLIGWLTNLSGDHPIGQEMVGGFGWQAITLVLAAVVWAPLVEECIFRGALYRHMRNRPGWASWLIASLLSSIIFAVIHPQGIVGVPVLTAIALVLAQLRELRNSLIPCIVAHALHNGMIMTLLLLVLYL